MRSHLLRHDRNDIEKLLVGSNLELDKHRTRFAYDLRVLNLKDRPKFLDDLIQSWLK